MPRPDPNGWWRDPGVFAGSYAVLGVAKVVPNNLHIHGCEPRPAKLLNRVLALLDPEKTSPMLA